MQVKIIKPPLDNSIWYNNHIGDIIEVEEDKFFDDLYHVIGPNSLLEYYEKKYDYNELGIDKIHVRDIRLEKLERILAEDK